MQTTRRTRSRSGPHRRRRRRCRLRHERAGGTGGDSSGSDPARWARDEACWLGILSGALFRFQKLSLLLPEVVASGQLPSGSRRARRSRARRGGRGRPAQLGWSRRRARRPAPPTAGRHGAPLRRSSRSRLGEFVAIRATPAAEMPSRERRAASAHRAPPARGLPRWWPPTRRDVDRRDRHARPGTQLASQPRAPSRSRQFSPRRRRASSRQRAAARAATRPPRSRRLRPFRRARKTPASSRASTAPARRRGFPSHSQHRRWRPPRRARFGARP